MAISTGVAQAAAITAAGPTQDITDATMSDTPKGGLLTLTLAVTNGTGANGAMLSASLFDGTSAYCQTSGSEDTGGVTNSWNRGKIGVVLEVINLTTGAVIAQATLVQMIPGGARIQWDTTTYALPAAAYKIGGAFWGGSDLSFKVATVVSSGALNGGTFTTNIGFRPDDILWVGHRRGFDDVSRIASATIFGVASYQSTDGDIDQGGTSFGDSDAQATGDPFAYLSPSRVYRSTSSGGGGVGLELIGVSAINNGQILTKNRDGSSSGEVTAFAALNYNGQVQHRVSSQTSPTATGNNAHTIGFAPQFLMVLPSLVASIDTIVTGPTGGATGIGFCNAGTSAAVGISVQDAALANTLSRCHARVIEIPLDTGAAGVRASLTTLADPTTLNYTTVMATAGQLIFWAIGQNFAQPVLPAVSLVYHIAAPSLKVDRIFILGAAHVAYFVISAPTLAVSSIANTNSVLPAVSIVYVIPPRTLSIDVAPLSDDRGGATVFSGVERGQGSFSGVVAGQAGIAT